MKGIYLDYCASTPIDSLVAEKMMGFYKEYYANPSSLHTPGQKSWNALNNARVFLANSINSEPNEIYFTSGGTEADTLALQGVMNANKKKGNHLIVSSIEHSAIFNTAKKLEKNGFRVDFLEVDSKGFVNLTQLSKLIDKDTVLVSIMMANNELGTIQDIKKIAEICHEKGAYFHTDAVQSFGKIKIDVKNLGIDLMSTSSHKIYGPKGVGFLYVKEGIEFEPLFYGGPHEYKKRAGTENLYSILGFAEAYKLMMKNLEKESGMYILYRKKFIDGLSKNIENYIINSPDDYCLQSVLNVSFPGVDSETMLLELDSKGVFVSAGSACSAKSIRVSRVLSSCGLSDEISSSAIRFSVGRFTSENDIDIAINAIKETVDKLRKMNPEYEG
jgi:cysteine desulfurase